LWLQNLISQIAAKLRDEEKYEEALPYARKSLELKPNDTHVLLFSGEIVLRNGDLEEAKRCFNKVKAESKTSSPEHNQVSLWCDRSYIMKSNTMLFAYNIFVGVCLVGWLVWFFVCLLCDCNVFVGLFDLNTYSFN
jgi:tetratricopeptide (TPR) repeat protein